MAQKDQLQKISGRRRVDGRDVWILRIAPETNLYRSMRGKRKKQFTNDKKLNKWKAIAL